MEILRCVHLGGGNAKMLVSFIANNYFSIGKSFLKFPLWPSFLQCIFQGDLAVVFDCRYLGIGFRGIFALTFAQWFFFGCGRLRLFFLRLLQWTILRLQFLFKDLDELVTPFLNFADCSAASHQIETQLRIIANIVPDQLPKTIAVSVHAQCHQTVLSHWKLTSLINRYILKGIDQLTSEFLVLKFYDLINLVTFFNFTLALLDSLQVFGPVFYLLVILPKRFAIILNIISRFLRQAFSVVLEGFWTATIRFCHLDEHEKVFFVPSLPALANELITFFLIVLRKLRHFITKFLFLQVLLPDRFLCI